MHGPYEWIFLFPGGYTHPPFILDVSDLKSILEMLLD